MVKKKLFVGNLPNNYDDENLRSIFEQYGTVAECDVLRNYGFVHMENEEEANQAVRALHHSMVEDCKINVQFSTTDVHKNPGVGSKGECFRCGKSGHFSRECPTNTDGNRGRHRGGGRGRGGYSNGRNNYDNPPSPRHDEYYEALDDYYRRPPPPGYGYRPRSRSPPMRRPLTPPGYRRRYSPSRDFDRYYERIPYNDPYYDFPPRRQSPVSQSYRRALPPPEEYRRLPVPDEEFRRPTEEFRDRPALPRDLEYFRRLEGKPSRPAARPYEERELVRLPERELPDNVHFLNQQANVAMPINFAEDVAF